MRTSMKCVRSINDCKFQLYPIGYSHHRSEGLIVIESILGRTTAPSDQLDQDVRHAQPVNGEHIINIRPICDFNQFHPIPNHSPQSNSASGLAPCIILLVKQQTNQPTKQPIHSDLHCFRQLVCFVSFRFVCFRCSCLSLSYTIISSRLSLSPSLAFSPSIPIILPRSAVDCRCFLSIEIQVILPNCDRIVSAILYKLLRNFARLCIASCTHTIQHQKCNWSERRRTNNRIEFSE